MQKTIKLVWFHRLYWRVQCRPVTVVATLTQIVAEAMAGMALTQAIRPGAPVVFGTFASTTNLQTGAPSFGGPESSLILYGAAQVARTLNLPFRSGGGLNAAKLPDAQAAYEAQATLTTATNAGVNFMLHSHGWLEGGLVVRSFIIRVRLGRLGQISSFGALHQSKILHISGVTKALQS